MKRERKRRKLQKGGDKSRGSEKDNEGRKRGSHMKHRE